MKIKVTKGKKERVWVNYKMLKRVKAGGGGGGKGQQ